jgi:hypothetical protein
LVIASVVDNGLAGVAIYTLAQNIASLIQAPQRGIITASISSLSKSWKEKNMHKINVIYKQSSINQLIFAVGMFALIMLNFNDGVLTFKMQSSYLDAKWIFFFIGLMRIIDMGTGVNSQIIGTSTKWRFEFFTGIILIAITLPLNYILTKYYIGIMGPAVANLFSFTIYNAIRYWFLLKKFKLQPFSLKTLYTVSIGIGTYIICYELFNPLKGIYWILLRSCSFIFIYGLLTVKLKLSDDIMPVWLTLRKKIGF